MGEASEVWAAEAITHAVLTLLEELNVERAHSNLTVSLNDSGRGFGSTKDKTTPDDKWSWALSVGQALKSTNAECGRWASRILHDRVLLSLTWSRIAVNVGLRETVCERVSESAARFFVSEIERRGLYQFVLDSQPKQHFSASCLVDAGVFPLLLVHEALDVVPGDSMPFDHEPLVDVE